MSKGKAPPVSEYIRPVTAEDEVPPPSDVPRLVTASGCPVQLLPVWSAEAVAALDWGSEETVYEDTELQTGVAGTVWLRPDLAIPESARLPPPPKPAKQSAAAAAAAAGAGATDTATDADAPPPPTPNPIDVVLLPPWVPPAPAADDGGGKDAKKGKKGGKGAVEAPPPTASAVPREVLRKVAVVSSWPSPVEPSPTPAPTPVPSGTPRGPPPDLGPESKEDTAPADADADTAPADADTDTAPADTTTNNADTTVVAGHAAQVFAGVVSAIGGCGASLVDNNFLWEAIYPKAADGRPKVNPGGKYAVKLHWSGSWRQVVIDDRLPCSDNGTPLFPIVPSDPQELWPALLFKAWNKLAGQIPGAATDTALLFRTLTGWAPQPMASPVSADHWALLSTLAPCNVLTSGDIRRAYLVACETARVRETRRQKLLTRHLEEEAAAEAAAAAADPKAAAKKGKGKDAKGGGKGGKGAAPEEPHDPVQEVAKPDPVSLPPAAVVLVLTAKDGATLQDGRPLTPGAPYTVLATRHTEDTAPAVLLRGLVSSPPTKKRPSRKSLTAMDVASFVPQSGARRAKPAPPAISAPVDVFLPVDPVEDEIWVPLDKLPAMFTDSALACHNPVEAAGVRTVPLHWLQPGETEADLTSGVAPPPAVETKGKGKGKDKKGGAPPPAADDAGDTDSLRERVVVPLSQHVMLKSVGTGGTGIVVSIVRDVVAPVVEEDSPSTDAADEAKTDDGGEGKTQAEAEAAAEGGEEGKSGGDADAAAAPTATAPPVDDYAVVTLSEDRTWDYFMQNEVVPPSESEAEETKADPSPAEDSKEADDAEGGDSPASEGASTPAPLFSGLGLPTTDRLVLRLGSDLLQGVDGSESLLACGAIHVPAGNHMYSIDIRAPLGCSVELLLPKSVSLVAAPRPGDPEPPAPESKEGDDADAGDTKEAEAEEEEPPEIAPGIPARIPRTAVVLPELSPHPRPPSESVSPAFDLGHVSALLGTYGGAHVVEAAGKARPCAENEWRVWFRYTVMLPALPAAAGADADADADAEDGGAPPSDGSVPAVRLWAQLALANDALAAHVRFYVVNNDTGDVAAHALLETGQQALVPNEMGYTLLATARRPVGVLPGSAWRLTVVSDSSLQPLRPTVDSLEVPPPADPAALAVRSFSGLYVPNKYYRCFRYMVKLAQPTCVVSVRLAGSDPDAWMRLEALDAHTGEVLARTTGRGAATFIALPAPPAPPEPEGGSAAAPPAKGGKGEKLTPAQEAQAAYKAQVASINSGVLGDAEIVLQGSIESSRWEPYPYMQSTQPFYDPDPFNDGKTEEDGEGATTVALSGEMLTWRMTVCGGVASYAVWRDTRWQDLAAAQKKLWEALEPGRGDAAEAVRSQYSSVSPASDEEAAAARATPGIALPASVWKQPADADGDAELSDEAKAQRDELRKQRRERARLLAADQSYEISPLGALVSAGHGVQVYHGKVEHPLAAQGSVLDAEGLGEMLAASRAAQQEAAGGDTDTDTKASPDDDEPAAKVLSEQQVYAAVMKTAREREQAARFSLLKEQEQALVGWQASTTAIRSQLQTDRDAARSAQLQVAEEAFNKKTADEAAAKAAAEAEAGDSK